MLLTNYFAHQHLNLMLIVVLQLLTDLFDVVGPSRSFFFRLLWAGLFDWNKLFLRFEIKMVEFGEGILVVFWNQRQIHLRSLVQMLGLHSFIIRSCR